jgi:hypothetical protein
VACRSVATGLHRTRGAARAAPLVVRQVLQDSRWARDVEHKIDRGQTIDPGRKFKLNELAAAYRQHFSSKGMGRSKSQSLAKIEKLLGHRRLIELKTPTFIDFCKTRAHAAASARLANVLESGD